MIKKNSPEQNGRRPRLEAGDGLRLAGLANHVNSLANAYRHLQGATLLVKAHEQTGLNNEVNS